MGSFRDRQRRLRGDEILNAAQQLLATKGYYAMSMDDLAEHVGIVKATLYQHLATKEDLVMATISRDLDRFVDFLASSRAAGRAPLERITDTLLWIVERRDVDDGPGLGGTTEELVRLFRDRPDFVAHQERCWRALWDVVEEAKAGGEIRSDVPTPVIVALFFSVAVGHLFGLIVREGLVNRQQLGEALVGILCQGLSPAPSPSLLSTSS